jgi:uncharacterized glyoxalase superfamily protein PhnB
MAAASSPATAVRYRDVAAAIDWLCRAFGFEKQTVVAGEDGSIDYAQLTCGQAMLMLAPVRDTPLDKLMKQPDEIGGVATQSTYLVVDDADAHHDRAKAAGAEIVLELQDDDFGGRGYTCRDPEGHVWMFGTYDPWQGSRPLPVPLPPPARAGGGRRPVMLAGLGAVVFLAVAAGVWTVTVPRQPGAVISPAVREHAGETRPAAEGGDGADALRTAHAQLEKERKAGEDMMRRLAGEQVARFGAERTAQEVRAQLERERALKVAAENAIAGKVGEEAQKRLTEERRARELAERTAREVRLELERERTSRQAAERTSAGKASEEALKRVGEERRAREAAEKAVREARAELERERAAKAAAEKSGAGAKERVADAEKAAKKAREELEQGRQIVTAAEMAKEFALSRADEERMAREAAEKAVLEVRAELERERQAKGPAAAAPPSGDAGAAKRTAELRASLDKAQKRAAEAVRARETAEKATEEAREALAREQAAKTQAWKVVSQLTRQLKMLQGGGEGAAIDDAGAAPKKARPRPRPRKKAAEPEE